jgi:hypothetical protein
VSLLDIAGDQTASVALIDSHAGRITRARAVAQSVAAIAGYSQVAGADGATVESLMQLSRALAAYDTAGVRASTAQIAATRAELNESLAQATQGAPTSSTSTTLQSTQKFIAVRDLATSEPQHHSSKE